MNNSTFTLRIKEGKLIISTEIEDYLSQYPDMTQVTLTIQSESNDIGDRWNKWFKEVEKLEILENQNEVKKYDELLINKYKNQGLEL
jgi:hypothetical protein